MVGDVRRRAVAGWIRDGVSQPGSAILLDAMTFILAALVASSSPGAKPQHSAEGRPV